ncbi:MAG: hypothetical protein KJ906_02510 [Nanoarchaeota archaeon]|nr:hypothetical protein [Nanoarchaeota archaeon]
MDNFELPKIEARAENYNYDFLDKVIDVRKKLSVDAGYILYDSVSKLDEFIESDKSKMLFLYGPKGVGKTLNVMLSLRNQILKNPELNPFYITYKLNEQFESLDYRKFANEQEWGNRPKVNGAIDTEKVGENLEDKNLMVLDDIHYKYDDIRFKGHDDKPLVDLLETISEFTMTKRGNKAIFVSEDSLTEQYCQHIKDKRFKDLLYKIGDKQHEVARPDIFSIFEVYGIKTDPYVNDLLSRRYATPRTVLKIAKNFANEQGELKFDALLDASRKRINNISPKGPKRSLLKEEKLFGLTYKEVDKIAKKIAENMNQGKYKYLLTEESIKKNFKRAPLKREKIKRRFGNKNKSHVKIVDETKYKLYLYAPVIMALDHEFQGEEISYYQHLINIVCE